MLINKQWNKINQNNYNYDTSNIYISYTINISIYRISLKNSRADIP